LIENYEACDVFNMDETGIFFRATSEQTYKEKGKECVGGKFSKERLTIALCANMTGEKQPAFVIEKLTGLDVSKGKIVTQTTCQ
jgi:hypothetical protein